MDLAQYYEALEALYHTYTSNPYGMFIAILFLLQPIAVTVIAALLQRESKKRKADNEKADKLASIRAEESRLSMRLTSASVKLGIVTAIAYKDGKSNGKLDAAVAEAEQAQKDYYAFINRIATEKISAI